MAKWLNYVSPRRYQNGRSAENQIEALIDALIEQPEEALAMLQQAGKQGEEVMNQIMQLAQSAQQGDQSPIAQKALQALETVNQMMQQSQVAEKEAYLSSLKCGGKAKKVKKAEKGEELLKCGGKTKKAEEGDKLLKCGGKAKRPSRKAKCGCVLKKVGGKIIEVDSCTELPIARKGCKIKKGEYGIADGLKKIYVDSEKTDWKEGDATQHTYYNTADKKYYRQNYNAGTKSWDKSELKGSDLNAWLDDANNFNAGWQMNSTRTGGTYDTYDNQRLAGLKSNRNAARTIIGGFTEKIDKNVTDQGTPQWYDNSYYALSDEAKKNINWEDADSQKYLNQNMDWQNVSVPAANQWRQNELNAEIDFRKAKANSLGLTGKKKRDYLRETGARKGWYKNDKGLYTYQRKPGSYIADMDATNKESIVNGTEAYNRALLSGMVQRQPDIISEGSVKTNREANITAPKYTGTAIRKQGGSLY